MVLLLDLPTPPEVDLGEFYLLPVVITAWALGWRVGVFFALLATVGQAIVDSPVLRPTLDWPTPLIMGWKAFSDFVKLSVLALVRDRVYQERALANREP